jgi:2-ketocyclohexanecarboxyl-CoA hydrolase
MDEYQDILYEERDLTAYITINRPDKLNAFRTRTYGEITSALHRAGWNREVASVVLAGAGSRAFGVGGDTTEPKSERIGGHGTVGVPVEQLHAAIRDIPKPVIAKVRGYAIGGGNVLATICDLTIAAESAQFGQVGPKVGSVDPGLGTAYLARIIGEKRAREFWYMCRRYSAREAYELGLVNKVVPDDELDAEVDRWCAELAQRSPTAIAIAKRSLNADTEQLRGIGALGFEAVALYYNTHEAKEGSIALREKRSPDFRQARERDRRST